MGGDRVARPDRAGFARGIVANGEDEIELGRARRREFVPALRAQPARVKAESAEQGERGGMNVALGEAAGAIGTESAVTHAVQQRLDEERERAVARASKEPDRKGVLKGKSVSGRVDLGGGRSIK